MEYIPYGAFGSMDPDINSPRVQQWNLTLEQQFGTSWGVSASYLGSYSDRLWAQSALNPGVFLGLGPCTLETATGPRNFSVCSTNGNLNQRRVLSLSGENPESAALIGNLDLHTSIGTQEYHGLRLSFRRRSATGLSLNGNYTLSRCYGHATTGGFPQLAQGPTNPDDPDSDRGRCDQDRTHLANFTVGVGTPDFDNAALSALASGWRVSGIVNARSGSWLNITTGSDRALNGQRFQEQRVNQVSDDVYGEGLGAFLNRAAFAQLYAATRAKLFAVSLRIVRERALAEEALQDSFVAIWNHASDYSRGKGAPTTWMALFQRAIARPVDNPPENRMASQ